MIRKKKTLLHLFLEVDRILFIGFSTHLLCVRVTTKHKGIQS